ncbi:MAG: J domain-containing protein [Oscillibacter sp.]|jgi:curved DNA-binding protein CbpA|nr:J domain-containing protein [Oscillibacter sp.]
MNDPYQVLGVPETASDAEVKKAYLDLARKYHPDNYHDNPLADLAEEKMKAINAAYEQITKSRSSSGSSGGYGYGYGGGGTARQAGQSSSGSSVLQQVRIAINSGDLSRAEAMLAAFQDHNAEWNFLRGAVCYRRGWMDEAKRYYTTACQMDPGSAEYRQALNYMENGAAGAYRPGGGVFSTEECGGENNMCSKICCAYLLCNGCGYWGFCR